MPQKVVGISEIYVSDDANDELVTYSLGSCICVTVYDPIAKVAGMIHYMLPLSKVSPEKAKKTPAMFADTGVTELLRLVFDLGAVKDRLIVKAAGGSSLMDQKKIFNIGERNYLILRKILWKNNILIKSEDVGGSISRTVHFNVDTGKVTVKTSKGIQEL
ncbi:MAG: chemotaxis protein CheD [Candidatus Zixiibacteriota bacterium]